MKCSQFALAVEEFLATHPAMAAVLPPVLEEHGQACPRCRKRWQRVRQSRMLLHALRAPEEPAPDPYFLHRVRARIAAQRARRDWRGMNIAWRDLVIALVLFLCTLGSFVYSLRRTEQHSISEAFALDVPHINPQDPSLSHRRPQPADVMLNLMNP